VDTRIRPPVVVRAAVEPGRRRRWPWIVLVVLALFLSVFLGWLVTFDPLGPGTHTFAIRDRSVVHEPVDVDAFGNSGIIDTVRMERGMRFRYLVSIANEGPLPITITDVSAGSDQQIARHAVAMDTNTSDRDGTLEPFAPFTMPSDAIATLEMEVTVSNDVCYEPNSSTGWYTEPVTFRVLGITRHADVETRLEIRLAGTRQSSAGC
jgi:hypothetical protein